jgi:NADH-ubiquinone oxidoreductase chain 5
MNHAFFKALLFLSAGSLIHNIDNKQDLRNLGNLIKVFPSNYSMFLIGSLTLAGVPFLSGFYSKDTIIEISFVNYSFHGFSIYFFSLFIAILTTIYSTRLIYSVYLKNTNLNKLLFRNLKDSGLCISITLIVLSLLSIFNGYFFSDLFIGIGSDFFNTTLFLNSQHYSILNAEFQNSLVKNLPFLFSIIFLVFSIFVYNQFI